MSDVKIQLSIQEMVKDFEELNRYDERLGVLFDLERATDAEINDFFNYMLFLTNKYIPTYEKHVDKKFFSTSTGKYERALMLYQMLYENFQEIFFQLV